MNRLTNRKRWETSSLHLQNSQKVKYYNIAINYETVNRICRVFHWYDLPHNIPLYIEPSLWQQAM